MFIWLLSQSVEPGVDRDTITMTFLSHFGIYEDDLEDGSTIITISKSYHLQMLFFYVHVRSSWVNAPSSSESIH